MRPTALVLSLLLGACTGGPLNNFDTGDDDTDSGDTDSDSDSGEDSSDTDTGDTDTSDTDTSDTDTGSACVDDAGEPDDVVGDATPLVATVGVSGQVCAADSDLYSLSVGAGCVVDALLQFTHATGDLDLYLLDSTGFDVDSSESTSNTEDIVYVNEDGDTTMYLEVLGYAGDEGPYTVSWTTTCPEPCIDDANEPDDAAGDATPLTTGAGISGQVCLFDDDWFAVTAPAGCSVDVSLAFTHADGDLDLTLRSGGSVVDSSAGVSNQEVVSYNNRAGTQAKALHAVVRGYDGAQNDYTITVTQDCDVCDDDPADDGGGNDTIGTAAALAGGVAFDGAICSTDVDWFAVAGENAGGCRIDATFEYQPQDGDLELSLVTATGTTLATSGGGYGLAWRLGSTQTDAYLKVAGVGADEGAYELEYTVTCGPCTDPGEQNNVDDDAHPLTAPFDARSCGVNDDDWYTFTAGVGCEGRVEVTIDGAPADDVDVWLYGALDATTWLDRSVSDDPLEVVYYDNTGAAAKPYWVQVEYYAGFEPDYTIRVVEDCTACVDDNGANDVSGGAVTLTKNVPIASEICEDDADWYKLTVADGCTADVLVDFVHGSGDIEADLYSASLVLLQRGDSGNDDEGVSYVNDVGTGATEQAYVKVYGFGDADNPYTISFAEVCTCTDDLPDGNDTFATARTVQANSDAEDLALCRDSGGADWDGDDWYTYKVGANCLSVAWIEFFTLWGDLDLVMYNDDAVEIDYSGSSEDDIEIVLRETGNAEETLYLQVLGYFDPGDDGNDYELHVLTVCD